MAKLYSSFVNDVLHKLREFSNAGAINDEGRNRDYLLSIPSFLNQIQKEIATTTRKIAKVYEIAHHMPYNQIGRVEWNEDQTHDREDVTFEANGSQAYSFSVAGNATVHIEEEINGTWTNKTTITNTFSASVGFVTYKGLIPGIVDEANQIRLRFSGDYYYPFRWVALFSQKYATDEEVPAFQPYVPYAMPENFFDLDRIVYTYEERQYSEYANYKYEQRDGNRKTILIEWYEVGEFQVHYWAYPTELTVDETNLQSNDSYELEIAEEAIPAAVSKVAALLMVDEDLNIHDILMNDFYIAMNNIEEFDNQKSGFQRVQNLNNW